MKLHIYIFCISIFITSCSNSNNLYEYSIDYPYKSSAEIKDPPLKDTTIWECSIDHPYKFSTEIKETLLNDTTIWKYEPAAWAYSRIGEHKQSLFQWEKSREALRNAFGFRDVDSLNIAAILQNYDF